MDKYTRPKRGDVFLADLGQRLGSEQGGLRPVVIIQNNQGNRYAPTFIAAPLTSRRKRRLPVHVLVHHEMLRYDSIVLLEQITVISAQRLGKYICSLSRNDMRRIDSAIKQSLALQ